MDARFLTHGKTLMFEKTMEFYNPNKKMRLDFPINHSGNAANEDLWGDDDITADDFDMATQPFQNRVETLEETHVEVEVANSFYPPTINDVASKSSDDRSEEMKQQQYEIEGKVRILSDSVDRITKELKEEKASRDKIIAEKLHVHEEKEKQLQKEIQKMQSVLQFKDQEMKTVYEKVHSLESQVQEKREHPSSSTHISPPKCVKKIKLESVAQPSALSSEKNAVLHRKYRLPIDNTLGETHPTDMMSSIICNHLTSITSSPYVTPLFPDHSSESIPCLSAVSVVRLDMKTQIVELLDYCSHVLKSYLTHLKCVSNTTASPVSLKKKAAAFDESLVVSSLKDLVYICSCPQFATVLQQCSRKCDSGGAAMNISKKEDLSTRTSDLSYEMSKNQVHSLLQTLFSLANLNTYSPNDLKQDVLEGSMAALASWVSSVPESLRCIADTLPIQSLVNASHTTVYSFMSLRFLSNICIYPEFIPLIIHKNDYCVICAIAELLCHNICKSPLEYLNVMSMVENFFSSLFSTHDYSDLKLEKSPCSSKFLHGIISSLWEFVKSMHLNKKEIMLVLRKGILLLHLIARYIPNFKEARSEVENHYISFVSGMLTLSKEEHIFKELYDLIHNLWDFQEDTSEFDIDE